MTLLGPTGHTAATNQMDVDRIRHTYTTVLGDPRIGCPLPEDKAQRENLAGLLRGHAGLLAPEIEQRAPGMRGEQRKAAEYVVARAYSVLSLDAVTSAEDEHLYDLAFLTRALLTLHEHPALGERAQGHPEG